MARVGKHGDTPVRIGETSKTSASFPPFFPRHVVSSCLSWFRRGFWWLRRGFGGFVVAFGGFVVAFGGFVVAFGGFVVAFGGFVVAFGGFVVAFGGFLWPSFVPSTRSAIFLSALR